MPGTNLRRNTLETARRYSCAVNVATATLLAALTLGALTLLSRDDSLSQIVVKAFVSTMCVFVTMIVAVRYLSNVDSLPLAERPTRLRIFERVTHHPKIMIIDVHNECRPLLRIQGPLGDVISAAHHVYHYSKDEVEAGVATSMAHSMREYADDFRDADFILFIGDFRRALAAAKLLPPVPSGHATWYGYIRPERGRSMRRLRRRSLK